MTVKFGQCVYFVLFSCLKLGIMQTSSIKADPLVNIGHDMDSVVNIFSPFPFVQFSFIIIYHFHLHTQMLKNSDINQISFLKSFKGI